LFDMSEMPSVTISLSIDPLVAHWSLRGTDRFRDHRRV